MDALIQKYQEDVTGVLSGWDRVRIRGMQRILANVGGMMSFLSHVGVRLKDFGAFVERTCRQVRTNIRVICVIRCSLRATDDDLSPMQGMKGV